MIISHHHCSSVRFKSDQVPATNELNQNLFMTGPGPLPLKGFRAVVSVLTFVRLLVQVFSQQQHFKGLFHKQHCTET